MTDSNRTSTLAASDRRHLWHPFTPMESWCDPSREMIVLEKGAGARLWDTEGRTYLDGNASIWTNIHGHSHPRIIKAVTDQMQRLAHSSFLGYTNEPAIRLGERLTGLFPDGTLDRVFYSDDGSTAIECAVKMAIQYWQLEGQPERSTFIAFSGAYHGDTMGAAALGGIDTFHGRFKKLGFPVFHLANADELDQLAPEIRQTVAGVAIEPLIQGAAGMKRWPSGMLSDLRRWCDREGVFLLLDEVMTGFGRTGSLFACEQENVIPDFMALAKGLTGGVLPLAATLTTERVFKAFLGPIEAHKTFYYGHSYCGNAAGCAAALASLDLFDEEATLTHLPEKIATLSACLEALKEACPVVGDTRQCGLIAGIDIVKNRETGEARPWNELTGARICEAARAHGLLTRPIRDTLVFMPPLCITPNEIGEAFTAFVKAIEEVA
ncbi:MAG: adenosylmethionine--8-amino-7-oxononanoate transaminase [Verrucomicrobiota bacterium]